MAYKQYQINMSPHVSVESWIIFPDLNDFINLAINTYQISLNQISGNTLKTSQ